MTRIARIVALVVIGVSLLAAGTAFAGNLSRFRAELDGAEETTPVITDATGKFSIRFSRDYSSAEFRLDVDDAKHVTQAHLHCAPDGVNGPVVVFLFGLFPGGVDVDGHLSRFTITDANIAAVGANCVPTTGMAITNLAELAAAAEAGLIYANVHSVEHPAGLIRGQLGAH